MTDTDGLMNPSMVNEQISDIANKVIANNDVSNTKELVELFNWTMTKKNVARTVQFNELYDKIYEQMLLRFNTKADQFSNSDLLDYLKTIQQAIEVNQKSAQQIQETPAIVNNTQINVNVLDTMSKESKDRVLSAIKMIMQGDNNDVLHQDVQGDKNDE